MTDRPRHDCVTSASPPRQMSIMSESDAKSVIPHETTASLRPRSIPGRRRSRVGDHVSTASVTQTFTANTCPKCGAITIAGLLLGIRLDLEAQPLTDLDEYRAVVDGIPTWNLHHDLQVTLRGVAEIRAPTRVERYATHTCSTTYGTETRTRTVTRTAPQPDEPPF